MTILSFTLRLPLLSALHTTSTTTQHRCCPTQCVFLSTTTASWRIECVCSECELVCVKSELFRDLCVCGNATSYEYGLVQCWPRLLQLHLLGSFPISKTKQSCQNLKRVWNIRGGQNQVKFQQDRAHLVI